jgi:hypothetical protein
LRSKLCVVVLLAAAGCSPGSSTSAITYDICTRVDLSPAADSTPAEIQAVDDAIALWRHQGVVLTRGDGTGATLPIHFRPAATVFHGVYEGSIGEVFVNRLIPDPHQRAVTVAHEVGHALGLVHIDRSRRISLMNPNNLETEPTPGDRQALIQEWGPCAAATP